MMKVLLDFLAIMTQKNGEFFHHDLNNLKVLRGLNDKETD